jgi:hypothetical protein
MNKRMSLLTICLVLAMLTNLPLRAEKAVKSEAPGAEEFFIISSADLAKNRLVLKHPTEVTELMLVTGKTSCFNDQGKTFACKNLRAGDTVFVVSSRDSAGARTAVRIRMGPMTVEEIHRKYVTFQ